MFPIRDHNPSGRVPFVTWALMVANILVFLSYVSIFSDNRQLGAFYGVWALIPARLSAADGAYTLVTSMFLHGGWMHLIGNMLFLFIFGDNVEDEMGHAPFLGFYMVSGLCAGALQVMTDPVSTIPVVGASGAIAGVMGAYLLLFPKARVDILIFLIVFIRILPIPAWIMLCLWFVMQFFGVLTASPGAGGVAYWAHAGGFIAGFALTLPLWFKRGGTAFWQQTLGQPPHPEARYVRSRIPKVRKR